MSATIDDDRTAQMAFIRTLVERAIGQVEGLLLRTDPAEAYKFAPLTVLHVMAEIIADRHGPDGPQVFLDAVQFAAETIRRGDRLTMPKTGARL